MLLLLLLRHHQAPPRKRRRVGYEFRPADRTHDYSATEFVISEALQQTDFDGIRHGVLTVGLRSARNRIPYWIDRRLNGLAGSDYDAAISFGLPIEPEDSQYGESRIDDLGEEN